jgi:hypothetical protein
LQQTQDAIEAATAGMSTDELLRRPAEGKWCAAEILEHLARAFHETIPGLEKCCERGQPVAKRATVYHKLARMLVVGFGHLPSGRPAPAMTVPSGMQPEETMKMLRESLSRMDDLFARCEKQFGRAKLTNHPVLGPLNAAQWRKFHWVHARHHVRQIAALRRRKMLARAGTAGMPKA